MAVHKHMEMLLAPVALQQDLPLVVAVVAIGVVGLPVSLLNLIESEPVGTQVAVVALATQHQK
jgi:hypothetical protein